MKNRLSVIKFASIKIISKFVSKSIRGSLVIKDNANDLLTSVKKQFVVMDKTLGVSLISQLKILKYDETMGVKEYILTMTSLATKLKEVEMSVSYGYLIEFIIDSLPHFLDLS